VRHSHIVEYKEPNLGSSDIDEIYANARLIAVAPELYEGLEELVSRFESVCRLSGSDQEHIDSAVSKYRAVLAKARGEVS
jgi:hypothetical protein